MTQLYRPVPIETAEQAEALPLGSIAYRTKKDETGQIVATLRYDDEEEKRYWIVVGEQFGYRTSHLVSWGSWSALVPVEAEEEHIVHRASGRTKTVYVTDWQEQ